MSLFSARSRSRSRSRSSSLLARVASPRGALRAAAALAAASLAACAAEPAPPEESPGIEDQVPDAVVVQYLDVDGAPARAGHYVFSEDTLILSPGLFEAAGEQALVLDSGAELVPLIAAEEELALSGMGLGVGSRLEIRVVSAGAEIPHGALVVTSEVADAAAWYDPCGQISCWGDTWYNGYCFKRTCARGPECWYWPAWEEHYCL